MSGRGRNLPPGLPTGLPPGGGRLMLRPTWNHLPITTPGMIRPTFPPVRHQLKANNQKPSTATSCHDQQSAAENEEGSLEFLDQVEQDTPFKEVQTEQTEHVENPEMPGPSGESQVPNPKRAKKNDTKEGKTKNPKASVGTKSAKKKKKLTKCTLCLAMVENKKEHERVYHKITQDICLKEKGHEEKKKIEYTKMCYHCQVTYEKDYEVLACRRSHGVSKCQHCDTTSNDAYDMLEHISTVHKMSVEFPCKLPDCKRTRAIKDKRALLQHQRREHQVGVSRGGDQEIPTCEICKREFKNARNLRDHKKKRTKPCKEPKEDTDYDDSDNEDDDNEEEDENEEEEEEENEMDSGKEYEEVDGFVKLDNNILSFSQKSTEGLF